MKNLYVALKDILIRQKSNIDISSIFESIFREERNFAIESLTSNKYYRNFQFGYLNGLYINGDERISSDLMAFVWGITKEDFIKDLIIKRYKEKILDERSASMERFKKNLDHNMFDYISLSYIVRSNNKLENISFDSMKSYICEDYQILKDIFHQSGRILTDDELFHFEIVNMMYKDFCSYMVPAFDDPRINFLEEYYKSKGIDLNDDMQYNKYGLISTGSRFEIKPSTQSKLYDKTLDTHILIKGVENSIVLFIKELKDIGAIVDVAFRVDSHYVADKIPNNSIIMEELEFGKIFSLSDLGSPEISKLYSPDNYDNLWVVISEGEITFEEICSNFEVHDDCIVTQGLHLQYSKIGGKYIINHLDHEYFFYTIDEFSVREKNPHQKGEARTRYKTFKIDNSSLPFFLDDGTCVLFFFLNRLFRNQTLLKEYFSKVV
ncbi:hypothetical protein [Azospirillum griseum]|uniref:Uncharacterized protein n=1 Tax=Azospirillum griseum TaxID=2496639 RepID=A0A431VDY8_9PROT|nr:hypothetical protein [Azospirillum griseum]RTR17460.1 hypothetical protein EJ903_18375 [Azospirillum griseum]